MGSISISMRDHTNEATTFTLPSVDLTAANIDAEYIAAIAVQSALDGVSLGAINRRNHIAKSSPQGVPEPAASEAAQRECKAMVLYANTVTFTTGRFEVPCVDLTQQMSGHPGFFYDKDYLAEVDAAWITFVGAVEITLSEAAGGDAVEVLRAYHIGKAT